MFCNPCAIAAGDVQEFVLDNGLKLLVKEDHRAPVVVSQVWYRVGASYEYDGITGISHALEHMMFRGTENLKPGEFSRIISANGGDENAFTGKDYTAYFQTMEKSRLPISFELEAERMQKLSLRKEEFEREIKVVREERRWRTEDSPQSYTYEVLNATAFQTSPYRQPTVGWMSDLNAMTVESLSDWYRKWYAPNNAIVVVVGDVNAEEVHTLAKEYFGPVPAREVHAPDQRTEVEQLGIKRVTVKRPAELPFIVLAYKTPVLKTVLENPDQGAEWEVYALEVLAGILDGGKSARFASNLIRGREIAASVDLDYNMISRLDDLLTVSGTPANGHSIAEMETALKEEIEKLKTQRISDEELQRVKNQVVAEDIYQRDAIFYQGMILGIFETVGIDWRYSEEYVEKVNQVTAEQVQEVAKKFLVDDRLTVAVLEPLPIEKNAPPSLPPGGENVR